MASNNSILICTDLDRTLLPNGVQEESPVARPLFRQLIERPEVRSAYVSGRDGALLLNAIAEYDLPVPNFAITDVGSTIYTIEDKNWQIWDKWHNEIGHDWGSHTRATLAALLQDLPELQLQEDAKQGKYKLSFYAAENADTNRLFEKIRHRLVRLNIQSNLIWSVDETTHTGLLDILPRSANKLHAIRFLMQENHYPQSRVVFAGDSGNDLEVLCSDIQSVLVANATPEVRRQAVTLAKANSSEAQLYLARGGFLNMNGNYAAGILEGVVHYLPETRQWLETD